MSKLTEFAVRGLAAASEEKTRRVIEAGLNSDRDLIAAACRGQHPINTAITEAQSDCVSLCGGKYVWTWDDDAVHGIVGDSLPEDLANTLRFRQPEALHLEVFQSVAKFVGLVHKLRATVTHLVVSSPEVDLAMPPRGLLALSGGQSLSPWLNAPHTLGDLEALTVIDGPMDWPAIEALPKLKHLGIWISGPTAEAILNCIPDRLLARLHSLDLRCTLHGNDFPYSALLAQRERFSALHRIVIGNQSVSDAARQCVEDWPQVLLTDHFRLEALASDLQFVGFASGHR